MANDDNGKQFERLSFYQLLKKTSVEIPIIQRDYAQGRKNQGKVRNKFLSALYDGFKEPIELDFVYGSEEKNTLQPLDGQQRLTTLFLLHWYIATKENKLDEDTKMQLSKFTYETRTSSREFCTELVEKGIVFENDKIISDLIKNTAWFVASWEKDPTISAMLIMLDAIHAKFKEKTDLWEKLITTDEENRPITFLYVKLKDFGLSDDLYIKMNARGKQLTPFENFKSQFEKHIEKNEFEKEIRNPEDKFAHKIDTIWTDLFWNYRGDDGLFDNELTNFIAGITTNYYAQSNASQKEEVKNRIQLLANPKDENGKLTLPDISPEDFSTKEAFQYLVDCLNVYENNHKVKTNKTPLWSYCDKTLFEELISVSNATQQQRVLFYAQTEYLLNNDTFDQDEFDDWMRVVRNIVENAISGNWNVELMINLIRLVHKWADNSNKIYEFLSTLDISTVSIAKEQVKEEIEKAKLIIASQNNRNIIHLTEDTNFCKGKIGFALYYIDYDSRDISTFSIPKLTNVKNVFEEHLKNDDVSNDFRRALFTLGNNDFYDYWSSSWLYAVESPKRCLIANINDLKGNFTNKDKWSKYLKDLVLKLCTETIEQIINSFEATQEFSNLPKWKQRIIKEKGLLDYSESHYIAIATDESCCWLIPYKRVANNRDGRKKLKKIK